MSRRTIGSGRVLGSGKSLSPAVAAPPKSPSPLPSHVLSPSASTLSLNSVTGSSTPPSSESQDIAARVSIDHGAANSTEAANVAIDRLVCPICNEEMMTLLQLNRHLDDVHKEIQQEQQAEAKDWFKQQMVKAKKFQPLAVLNQKLKGLDVFESNNDLLRGGTPTPRAESFAIPDRGGATPTPPPRPAPQIDPDDAVTKQHWQKRSAYDICSDPTCGKRLGSTSPGSIHCRHCGKLFCEEHTMYQMKLSRSAKHEPVRGFWCRVCETCYKSREGYNDRHGFERDWMQDFGKMRQERVSKMTMEVTRLEKRLSRLTQLLANPPDEIVPVNNKRWSLSSWGQMDPRKALEQSVVSWQNDADIARCPYCQQNFTQYTFRRHHCRTCGKVVCGDLATQCSVMLGLNVATTNSNLVEKPPPDDHVSLDIRLCKDCNRTLFSQRDFELSLSSPETASFSRSYSNLLQFERGIRMILPRFQKLLQALQDPESPPTSTQITDASRTRKRLMDSFTQYDTAARRIRDMPSTSATQLKLQKAIHQNATQFLHLHMLPLKALPKILKHATPHGNVAKPDGTLPGSSLANGRKPQGALAAIQYNHVRQNSSSNISLSSMNSSRVSEMEAEEKSLRERLIVLEEQKFLVQEMVADANKRRKFDEVAALAGNAEDLNQEIDSIQKQLDGLDFESAYTGVGNGLGSGINSPVRSLSLNKVKAADHG